MSPETPRVSCLRQELQHLLQSDVRNDRASLLPYSAVIETQPWYSMGGGSPLFCYFIGIIVTRCCHSSSHPTTRAAKGKSDRSVILRVCKPFPELLHQISPYVSLARTGHIDSVGHIAYMDG